MYQKIQRLCSGTWDTEVPCEWKAYTPKVTSQCLQKTELLVLGDSRGRQVYRSLSQRIKGGKAIDDTPWNRNESIPFPKIIENPDTKLKFYWLNNFNVLRNMLKENLKKYESEPKTFILGYHFLWSVKMYPSDNTKLNATKFVDQAERYKRDFITVILPIIIELADSGNRFLWASTEHRVDFSLKESKLSDKLNITYKVLDTEKNYQMLQNYLMDDVNDHIERWIFKLSHKNIYFMSANSRNTENLSKTALFLGDMTHKMVRDKKINLPFPLWLDTNYMLNFACNNIIGADGSYCEN